MVSEKDAALVSRTDYDREESELFCDARGKYIPLILAFDVKL